MATVAQSTQNQDCSLPPASNLSKQSVPERLVWHQFQGFWWPGMFYTSLDHFNREILEELDRRGDKATKTKLAYHLLNQALATKKGGSSLRRGIVRYLGRPIFDYDHVNEGEYQDYYSFVASYLMEGFPRPEVFGPDNYQLYMDYFRGIDESMAILAKSDENYDPSDTSVNEKKWEEQAQQDWEQHNWNTVVAAPTQQQQQQRQQQQRQSEPQLPLPQAPAPPHSPNTNSVAAVSLADESMVSANTGASSIAHHQQQQQQESSPETPMRNSNATPSKGATPTLDSSPIRNLLAPWAEVSQKLIFSDWNLKSTKRGKIYTHPNLNAEFTEEQVKQYVKKHYGWLGERRTTRRSNPTGESPQKKKTFGVLWKKFLEPAGWTMPSAPPPIDFHYVRPGRSVAKGIEGEDYFISTDAVVDFCANVDEYQSSSSESEVSPDARNQARAIHSAMDTDDDESTKLPPETDDDGSTVFLTPRDQRTKPQDPAEPLVAESTSESESEEDRYHFNVLWHRLKDEDGWIWMHSKSQFESYWYVPPSSLPTIKEDVHAWKSMTKGIDYFAEDADLVEYIKMKEGVGLSEEEYNAKIAATLEISQSRPRRVAKSKPAAAKKSTPRKKNSQPKAKKATEPKKKSKAASQVSEVPRLKLPTKNAKVSADSTPAQGAAKEAPNSKKKKRPAKDSNSSKPKKPRKIEDIDVRCHLDYNPAPWAVTKLPTHVHSVLLGAGFTYIGRYWLPGESAKNYTKKFESAQEAIQFCASNGNLDLSACAPEARASMERLLAYANVPDKQSTWHTIRAITTRETIAFLNLLGYQACSDGSWKVTLPEMVEVLEKELFESLDDLVLALRQSDTLIPRGRRGRHGSMDGVLRKEQMLALRLRIAAGLGDEEADSSDSYISAPVQSEKSKPSIRPAKKAKKGKQVATKTKTRNPPNSESESSASQTGNNSHDESSTRVDETSESGAGDINNESDDDSIAINNAVVTAVANLRASQISSKSGWQLLQRVGCSWSNGYCLPKSSERYFNQNDLVHHILKKSVLELDFLTNPLPKVELQQLHRYLKFQFVSVRCSETIGKALNNMQDSSKITASLAKIGFKQLPNGCYEHEHIMGQVDLSQIVNIIRAQREDLLLIGKESRRSREKKTLADEEDYTLRIWAAESDVPLQFFDEENNCKEALDALKEDQEMDEEEEDAVKLSEEINMLSQHSNAGDKVLEIEDAEISNTGFIDHSSRNQDSDELLSRSTVPVSRKTSAERAEAMVQPDCAFEVMTQSRDSASSTSKHNEPIGELMPLMTQPQGDESEDENDLVAKPSSLFDKAISPHERKGSSHSQAAMEDAESAEPDGIEENHDFESERSREFSMIVDIMGEDSNLQAMDEDGRKAPSNANPMPMMMTQIQEDD
ncbi:MAG: hypothetical protein SGBAC_000518 [Bacillariaceae sp.]